MDFPTLVTEVYNLTKRPDKVTETISALKNAILKRHTQDFWSKDIVETGIVFSAPASTVQSLAYKTLFPLWRAVSYIQPLDGSTFIPSGDQLEEINPRFAVDDYDVYKNGVWYEAGQVIQIRTLSAFQYYGIGYYQFPDISSTVPNTTWIMADYPYSLIYEAAAIIFKGIGFIDQEKSMRELSGEQAAYITLSNTQASGY